MSAGAPRCVPGEGGVRPLMAAVGGSGVGGEGSGVSSSESRVVLRAGVCDRLWASAVRALGASVV